MQNLMGPGQEYKESNDQFAELQKVSFLLKKNGFLVSKKKD